MYVEKKFPKKVESNGTEFNKKRKEKVRAITNNFVEIGQPGAMFKPIFDEMLNKLKLPEHAIKSLEDTELAPLLKNSRYSAIPSFFKLVQKLKEDKRDFVIVFRSFGSDLKDILTEFNAYSPLIY